MCNFCLSSRSFETTGQGCVQCERIQSKDKSLDGTDETLPRNGSSNGKHSFDPERGYEEGRAVIQGYLEGLENSMFHIYHLLSKSGLKNEEGKNWDSFSLTGFGKTGN